MKLLVQCYYEQITAEKQNRSNWLTCRQDVFSIFGAHKTANEHL